MDSLVLVEGPDDDGVTVVRLNRPERNNALSVAMCDAIADVLDGLARDEATKVVIVTGAGSAFSVGFDLTEFGAGDGDHQRTLWESTDRFHETLLRFPLPAVAAVNGPALAGGFDLAVLCDLRLAATTARFGHPEVAFGPVVYGPLHDLVGGAAARELTLTGKIVDAAEALELRLVGAVMANDALLGEARKLARRIAGSPREVLMHTKAKIVDRMGIRAGTSSLDL